MSLAVSIGFFVAFFAVSAIVQVDVPSIKDTYNLTLGFCRLDIFIENEDETQNIMLE